MAPSSSAAAARAFNVLRAGRFSLSLEHPLIMGVVNVTPDSFSDGGRFLAPHAAAAHARRLIEEGADIVDLGGESSRPGAAPVTAEEELARLIPVVRALHDAPVPLSVDTTKPEVMRAALAEGAAMVNDITALASPGALQAVAGGDCAVCLMHMQGEPRTMQASPVYDEVVRDVKAFLSARVAAAERAGIGRERIVIDPGFGFGKTVDHNLELLRRLRELSDVGVPVLAGWSRKSSLGRLTGRPAEDRLAASVAAALIAVQNGASIVRAHDVAATRDALAVWRAVAEENRPPGV
jgi:dihydropteroate synthase